MELVQSTNCGGYLCNLASPPVPPVSAGWLDRAQALAMEQQRNWCGALWCWRKCGGEEADLAWDGASGESMVNQDVYHFGFGIDFAILCVYININIGPSNI